MENHTKLSIYLCRLLRHDPGLLELEMDERGWVSAEELICKINAAGKHRLDMATLEQIVREDQKGRYRLHDGRIKCCQGHSIPWVIPEVTVTQPPAWLYHGTNAAADQRIMESGAICRMARHAVHMHADAAVAWRSGARWKRSEPVLLQIDAARMHRDGYVFAVTENDVWCTEQVPVAYVARRIRTQQEAQELSGNQTL